MHRLVRNISFVSAGGLLENILGFFFMVYVARKLGVVDFGKYALIGTIVFLVQRIISVGIDPVAIRNLATNRNEEQNFFYDIFSFKICIGILAYLGLMGIDFLLSYEPLVSALILIHGLDLILSSVTRSYELLYTAREEQHVPVAFATLNSLMTAGIGIVILETGGGLKELFIATMAWAFLFMVCWSAYFFIKVFRLHFRVRLTPWKMLIKEALPLAPIVIVNRTNRQINLFMLSKIPGTQPADLAMGLLQPALAVTNIPIRFFMRLRGVFLAWLANRMGRELSLRSEFTIIVQLITIIFAAPMVLSLSYFSKEIIALVFGETFTAGSVALSIVGWAAGLNLLIIVTEGFVFATGQVTHFIKVYVAILLGNCLLCLALIPLFGVNGAAAALLVTRILQAVAMFAYCNKLLPDFSFGLKQAIPPIMVIVLMFGGAEVLGMVFSDLWGRLLAYTLVWGGIIALSSMVLLRAKKTSCMIEGVS